MNILAIGAHPDDIEMGCGGTLIKLKQKGYRIFFLIITNGQAGGNAEIRKQEAQTSADLLGVEKIFWAGIEDTKIMHNQTLISIIENIVKQINPDEIYFNYLEDEHQDHKNLAASIIPAVRYVKKVFMYETYSTINFSPDFFVDIENVYDKKIELLKCHKSQLNKVSPSKIDLVDSVKSFAYFRGFACRRPMAEGFKLYRYIREI